MDSEATIIESETRYTLNIPCKCNGRRRLTGVSGTFISVHSENNDRFKVSEHVCCVSNLTFPGSVLINILFFPTRC